jgi:hypothetical protein
MPAFSCERGHFLLRQLIPVLPWTGMSAAPEHPQLHGRSVDILALLAFL